MQTVIGDSLPATKYCLLTFCYSPSQCVLFVAAVPASSKHKSSTPVWLRGRGVDWVYSYQPCSVVFSIQPHSAKDFFENFKSKGSIKDTTEWRHVCALMHKCESKPDKTALLLLSEIMHARNLVDSGCKRHREALRKT